MTERGTPARQAVGRTLVSAVAVLAVACALTGATSASPSPPAAPAGESSTPAAYSLGELEERAMARAPRVREARQRVAIAEARFDRTSAGAYPTFYLDSYASYSPGRSGDAEEEQGSLFDNWGPLVRVRLKGEMPLYTFGRLAAESDAAAKRVAAARSRVAVAQERALRELRSAYHAYVAAGSLLDVWETVDAELALIRERLEMMEEDDDDDFDPIDPLKLRLRDADVRQELKAAARSRAIALARIRAVVDMASDVELRLETPESPTPAVLDLAPLDEYVALARTLNAELQARRHELLAARDKVRSTKRAQLPEIFVAGRLGYDWAESYAIQLSPFADDSRNSWGVEALVGVRVRLDVERLVTAHDIAEGEMARTARETRVKGDAIELSVVRRWGTVRDLLQLLPARRRAARAARGWFFARSTTYDVGLVSLSETLKALDQMARRQAALIDTVRRVNTATAELSALVGIDIEALERARERREGGPQTMTLPPGIELPESVSPELRRRLMKYLEPRQAQ